MKMEELLHEVKARAEAKVQENPKRDYADALNEALEEVLNLSPDPVHLTTDQKEELLAQLMRSKLDELRGKTRKKTRKLRDKFFIFKVKLPEDLLEDIPEDILNPQKDPEDPS